MNYLKDSTRSAGMITTTDSPIEHSSPFETGFKISNLIITSWEKQPTFTTKSSFYQFSSHSFDSRKENLYLEAIRNMVKQKEFLSLMYQLSTDQLTEEEVNEELDSNSSKYLITVREPKSADELTSVTEICFRLNLNLSTDDISEMFGINSDDLERYALSVGLLKDEE